MSKVSTDVWRIVPLSLVKIPSPPATAVVPTVEPPSVRLSSAVVAVTPSRMFNSAVVEVTPSKIFSSAVVAVTPSNKFNSAGVEVIAVSLSAANTGNVPL